MKVWDRAHSVPSSTASIALARVIEESKLLRAFVNALHHVLPYKDLRTKNRKSGTCAQYLAFSSHQNTVFPHGREHTASQEHEQKNALASQHRSHSCLVEEGLELERSISLARWKSALTLASR